MRMTAFFALFFAIVGPPIGGIVAWLFMGLPTMQSPLPFISGSYAEGVVLAFVAGVLLGILVVWFRLSSWLMPIAVAALVTLAFLAISVWTASEPLTALWRVASVFVVPSIVATLACWYLATSLFKRIERRPL
jgi:hypothetical protein